MAIAKYRFDVFTNTLTISKAFEKNASNIGSAEQKLLSEFMAKYGDSLVIERYAPTRKPRDCVLPRWKTTSSAPVKLIQC